MDELSPLETPTGESLQIPQLKLITMFRLGLFQVGLGMMSVLVFGVLNRVLIRELGVPAGISGIILAMTLFVAPARVWFGQLSDHKMLWGYHRSSYVWLGSIFLALVAFFSVQVMWQVGDTLKSQGWTISTYFWMALLALMFALYGLAVSACSTPFATLLVDVSDEENRSKLVGIDWSMLIGGTILGAITIGILLKQLSLNPAIDELQNSINRLFLIVPWVVCGLAFVSTWGVEEKYSRYRLRSRVVDQEERITFKRAWQILTANRQTRIFFTFLCLMTLGLFLQDPVLENYGGDIFHMEIGKTASLNAFWGTGTLVGLSLAGFLLTPRVGKRKTAQIGCFLVIVSLLWVILSGLTQDPKQLQAALLFFGLMSGIATTGGITLMLDLTVAETAGTFIGAWGLAQALSKGFATVIGSFGLELGKQLFPNVWLSYSFVFILQGIFMGISLLFLAQVDIKEFKTNAQVAISAVMESDMD